MTKLVGYASDAQTQATTMEYTPRYAQPFTLTEAIGLDVSIITDGGRKPMESIYNLLYSL